MTVTADQITEDFDALGLPLSTPLLDTLTSIPGNVQVDADVVALPIVQRVDAPIIRMFELTEGRDPSPNTSTSLFQSGLTHLEIARELVASQGFADTYTGGALLDPKAPVSTTLVDELFVQALGHTPQQRRKPDSMA